jgi:hypothetical protein
MADAVAYPERRSLWRFRLWVRRDPDLIVSAAGRHRIIALREAAGGEYLAEVAQIESQQEKSKWQLDAKVAQYTAKACRGASLVRALNSPADT